MVILATFEGMIADYTENTWFISTLMNLFPDNDKEYWSSLISCSRRPWFPQRDASTADGRWEGNGLVFLEAGGMKSLSAPTRHGMTRMMFNQFYRISQCRFLLGSCVCVSMYKHDADTEVGKCLTCVFLTVRYPMASSLVLFPLW